MNDIDMVLTKEDNNIFSKYKGLIITGFIVLVLLTVLLVVLLVPKKEKVALYIELEGKEVINIYVGEEYEEPGFIVYDSKKNRYDKEVKIETNLDINTPGEYIVTYKINDYKIERKVIVLEKTFYSIELEKVDDSETIYLKINGEYKEPGYKIIDNKGNDVTNDFEVDVNSDVDASIPGTYKIIYTITDSENNVFSKEREVVVIENKIELSVDKTNYTNTDVLINIKVIDEYFEYILLPDGEKVEEKEYTYSVEENGVYKFVLYNEKGFNIEKEIDIKNIDKEKPSGTCSGTIQDGKTIININAKDNIKVKEYKIGKDKYTTNKITINEEKKDINVEIYDEAGNNSSISCDVSNKNINIVITPSTTAYTNGNVVLTIKVEANDMDYVVVPSGKKVYEKNGTYTVRENGTYTFTVYNKDGYSKSSSIPIKNIDKIAPTGICSGSYKDGASTINVQASDNVMISKYIVNGITHTTNNIIVNSEITLAIVNIYDVAGNTKSISCVLEDKNISSDSSITFSYNYFTSSDTMSYGLFTPSIASSNKKTPLIVWLHGSGERGVGQSTFKNSGLLKVINEWSLEGFNAYVLCPQLSSGGNWSNETTRLKLENLISKIVKDKKINTDKIILVGHSLGGQGVQYMAAKSDLYSALVVLSGYSINGYYQNGINYIDIPTVGYVGKASAGEDSTSYNYMVGDFTKRFGADNVNVLNVSHGAVPKSAFVIDNNKDNKSDLVEWMLKQ